MIYRVVPFLLSLLLSSSFFVWFFIVLKYCSISILLQFPSPSTWIYKMYLMCSREHTQHEHLSNPRYEHWDYGVGGIQTSNLQEVLFLSLFKQLLWARPFICCWCIFELSAWISVSLYRPLWMLAPTLYRLSPACWNSSAWQQGLTDCAAC